MAWGYASYDEEGHLIYTKYNDNNTVDKYRDNGDGGHSHERWNSQNDYNLGKDADYCRTESNNSDNPSIGNIESSTGCYLTTACIKHYTKDFDDNCYYLDILRWFRDNYVSVEDVNKYYEIAPTVVNTLNKLDNCNELYDNIYKNIIQVCVRLIEIGKYKETYKIYKNNILDLEKKYVKK